MSELVLFRVEVEGETFYLVARDDDAGVDMADQLCEALGQKMSDPLPCPLKITRVDGRVAGRVQP